MKANALLTVFLCVAIAALFNLHCSGKDEGSNPCALTNCLNGGTCISGGCNCPTWYEGTNCGQEARARYFGVYTGLFTAQSSSVPGLSNIEKVTFSQSNNGVDHLSVNIDNMEIRLYSTSDGSFTGDLPHSSVSGLTLTTISGSFSGNHVHLQFGGLSTDIYHEPRAFFFDGDR